MHASHEGCSPKHPEIAAHGAMDRIWNPNSDVGTWIVAPAEGKATINQSSGTSTRAHDLTQKAANAIVIQG
ncbi:unnamed protein product [Penicillium camemberti]|uniref:Str. FM013 n=1 Tax=Penicillium camemberti (strain FM 013) TaxID=1429867 RepID=A0A0G4NYT3_PENC3|nr:unnamed protein product [Penicillium camemberti]